MNNEAMKSIIGMVLTDIEHQLESIETGDLGAMWDTDDLGNWQAMHDNLIRVVIYLQEEK